MSKDLQLFENILPTYQTRYFRRQIVFVNLKQNSENVSEDHLDDESLFCLHRWFQFHQHFTRAFFVRKVSGVDFINITRTNFLYECCFLWLSFGFVKKIVRKICAFNVDEIDSSFI